MGGVERMTVNPEEMLERQIASLRAEITSRFDALDTKMDKYATKESVKYLTGIIIGIFLLILTLHGVGDTLSSLSQVMK